MDKQTFYAQLSGKLTELGVAPEYIERHLRQFDNFFTGKDEDEIENEIEKLGNLDRVAARIKRMTDKIISTGGDQEKDASKAEEEADAEAVNLSQRKRSTAEHTDRESQSERADSAKPQSEKSNPADKGAGFSGIKFEAKSTPVSEENSEAEILFEDYEGENVKSYPTVRERRQREAEPDLIVQKRKLSSDTFTGKITLSTPDEQKLRENTRKFWTIFWVSSPLILFALLLIAFLFGAAFFSIAMLIIASVAFLVAVTAGGALISLFGIIFGVIQMISSFPIGLYEIGLSIIFGASALFVGILVYNFAVRLMPYAARRLLVFMKYVYFRIKDLFIYVKKESIGL